MALNSLKEQMEKILSIMSTLNDTDRQEAVGFINNCVTRLSSSSDSEQVLNSQVPNELPNTPVLQPKEVEKEFKSSRRKQIFGLPKKKCIKAIKNVDKKFETASLEQKKHTPDRTQQVSAFRCPLDLCVFFSRSKLIAHLTSHPKSNFSCRVCRNVFTSALRFWRHKQKKECHKLDICSLCKKTFKNHSLFMKHIRTHGTDKNDKPIVDVNFSNKRHTERDLIPCKFCSKNFSTHPVLYNHYRLKHSRGKFVCLSCGAFLTTKEKYRDHCLIHENEKNWKCEKCELKFYRKQQFLVHIRIHESGKYKCTTCAVSLTSLRDLYKHRRNGHTIQEPEPKFECSVCNRKFKRKFNLANHMTLHNNERYYQCSACQKTFRTAEALSRHKKSKDHLKKAQVIPPESEFEKIYEDKFICETCGKQYNSKQLTFHLRVHKNLYPCDVCSTVCSLKYNLVKHKKLHEKTSSMCELCGMIFLSANNLKNHMLHKHNPTKKARCDVCGKSFKRNSELKRHKKCHENERPFVCYCGQSYKLKSHLKRHQEAHKVKLEPYLEVLIENNNVQGNSEGKQIPELNSISTSEFRLTEIDMHLNGKIDYSTDDYSHKSSNDLSALDMTVIPCQHDLNATINSNNNTIEEKHGLDLNNHVNHNFETYYKSQPSRADNENEKQTALTLEASSFSNNTVNYLLDDAEKNYNDTSYLLCEVIYQDNTEEDSKSVETVMSCKTECKAYSNDGDSCMSKVYHNLHLNNLTSSYLVEDQHAGAFDMTAGNCQEVISNSFIHSTDHTDNINSSYLQPRPSDPICVHPPHTEPSHHSGNSYLHLQNTNARQLHEVIPEAAYLNQHNTTEVNKTTYINLQHPSEHSYQDPRHQTDPYLDTRHSGDNIFMDLRV